MASAVTKSVFSLLLIAGQHVVAQPTAIQSPKCGGTIHGVVFDLARKPTGGISVVAFPLGVDLGALLPSVKADQNGEYQFEHICRGRYTVIAEDLRAGYPIHSPYQEEFLYGTRVIAVRLNWLHRQAEISVHLPPKPGSVLLHVRNSKTNSEILKFGVTLRVVGQRRFPEEIFGFTDNPDDREFIVPPDRNMIVLVKADGYKELSKSISVNSGTRTIVDLDIEPID